jgi:hypothetical protein
LYAFNLINIFPAVPTYLAKMDQEEKKENKNKMEAHQRRPEASSEIRSFDMEI